MGEHKQSTSRRFNDIQRTTKVYLDYIDNNLEAILARGYKQPDWYSTQSRFTIEEFVLTTEKAMRFKEDPPRKKGRFVRRLTSHDSTPEGISLYYQHIGTIIDMNLVRMVSEYMFYDCLNTGNQPTEFTARHRKAVRMALYNMYNKYK